VKPINAWLVRFQPEERLSAPAARSVTESRWRSHCKPTDQRETCALDSGRYTAAQTVGHEDHRSPSTVTPGAQPGRAPRLRRQPDTQLLDQPIRRDGLVVTEQQDRPQRAPRHTREREQTVAAVGDLDRVGRGFATPSSLAGR
jgi:hypothetical protein